MTDKVQLIKQEIERLRDYTLNIQKSADGFVTSVGRGRVEAFNDILKFIDSLPEEPVREDINEELERIAYSLPHSSCGHWPKGIDYRSAEARTKYGVHHAWSYEEVKKIVSHFLQMKGGE